MDNYVLFVTEQWMQAMLTKYSNYESNALYFWGYKQQNKTNIILMNFLSLGDEFWNGFRAPHGHLIYFPFSTQFRFYISIYSESLSLLQHII